jgi:dimethylargininase
VALGAAEKGPDIVVGEVGEAMKTDFALVREPALTVVNGLRAVDRGDPTFEGVRREFDQYVAALQAAGVAVEVLPALADFPDSIFVEDTALVLPEAAILLRPGAPSRFGEVAAIAPVLGRRFDTLLELADGFAEGGDVLMTPRQVFIGLSARTTPEGARALVTLLDGLGRRAAIVQTPADVLHFKTDCSLLDEETILSTKRLASSGVFDGYRVLLTPEGEEAAANSLRVNASVLVGDRFRKTADLLSREGYDVVPLPGSQIALLDAGFSCLSLRW